MTKQISLTQNKYALVDDEDYEELSNYKWYAENLHGKWYAVRRKWLSTFKYINIKMHSTILQNPEGTEPDHINGNGLDNRRCNLRVATHMQNSWNTKLRSDNTSGYKGVTWSNQKNKWMSKINFMGKQIYIGFFVDVTDAAHAYDDKAKELFGEFAHLNFPD